MSWKPLLEGDLAERADSAISAIAAALEGPPEDVRDFSLSSGHTGLALFFGHLSRARNDPRLADLARARLSSSFDLVGDTGAQNLGLFLGLSGLAWTYHHLAALLDGGADAGSTADFDELVLEALGSSPWPWEWDLVYGLAGIGVYALDHPSPSFKVEALNRIVDRLDELALETSAGTAWRTQPAFLNRKNAELYPEGRFDQGLAHGIPGVVGFLASLCARGLGTPTAMRLLQGAAEWLVASRRPDDGGSHFTYFPPEMLDARCAWCYGDPGVAGALLAAGTVSADIAWIDLSRTVARRAAHRPVDRAGVIDAGLCHGAAGLGHIFNRWYQATGEPCLATAARSWLERALDMRRPEGGIGGYLNWWPEIREWRPESGVLVGAAGIGLALLAAIGDSEPTWDSPFLLPAGCKQGENSRAS